MESNTTTQWSNISTTSSAIPGVLRITNKGFQWKNKSGKTAEIEWKSITGANWMVMGPKAMLELTKKSGSSLKFDGFKDTDFEKLNQLLESKPPSPIELVEENLASKGWNWASDVNFSKETLTFMVNDQRCFEIPLADVARSTNNPTSLAKNDVAIEFQSDDTQTKEQERLTNIRFWVPNLAEEDSGRTSAQEFNSKILRLADIGSETGQGIVEFQNLDVRTPRGRYTVEFFPSFIIFRGKSYDYKILWKNVSRIFQLQKPDNVSDYVVIHFDTPIGTGNVRYTDIVMQFNLNEEEENVKLNIGSSQLKKLQDKNSAIKETMSDKLITVFTNLLNALSGLPIETPKNFSSAHENQSIACSVKANAGFLYPLEKVFMFVPKPPTFIPFDQINSIEFARVTGSTNNTFDLNIAMTNGASHQFTGIQRPEYTSLFEFIESKNIKIKNAIDVSASSARPKREALTKVVVDDQDEDDESEEDEDFVAGDEDDDIPEEYQSDFSEDEEFSEEDDQTEKKSKKSKKEKKHKKEKKDKKVKKEKAEKRSAPEGEGKKKAKVEKEED